MSFVKSPGGNAQIDIDPGDSAIYGVDFSGRLEAGDTIATCSATALATTITAGAAAVSGSIVKARISGATLGSTTGVTFTANTAGGDKFNETIYFRAVLRS
jgi:hypothetical protein